MSTPDISNPQLRDPRREHIIERRVRRQRALLAQSALGHLRRDIIVHRRHRLTGLSIE